MYLFIYYLFFSVNKVLLTTANNKFYNLMLLKLFWHTETVPQRCSSGEGCSAAVLRILGGASVCWCDFNKVVKWLCWGRASARLFCCGFASCLQSVFVGGHLWRTTSELPNTIFNLFFSMYYTFEDFKVSVPL